ncbi:MAG: hypothetical protein ACT4N4_04295 [Rhodospirillales bacterium]
MNRISMFGGLAALVLASQAMVGQAWAAPQPLGLVLTIEPAPLHCAKGKCMAVLATFCLQQERLPPGPGDEYLAAPGTSVTLTIVRATGARETVEAAQLLRFVSYTGFTTISAEIPAAALGPNVAAASVEVGPMATLLPVPLVGDLKPLSQDEIALAVGPLRQKGEELFDKANPRSDANRIIARAISVLPESWREDGAAAHEQAWSAALAAPSRGFTQGGVALGRRMFAACKNTVSQSLKWALRGCLERRLDEQQREINGEYWQQPGS